MVKSIVSILVSLLVLFGISFGERRYTEKAFEQFGAEIRALARKVDEKTATKEDGKIIRLSWEKKKRILHVWTPHNDVTRFDDILSEAIQLIDENDFALASAKLEILSNLCKTVPDTYDPSFENIF